MTERDPSDPVQIKFRCREYLRAQLEAAAKERDHSINSEMVRRLDASFEEDRRDEITQLLAGGTMTARLAREIFKALTLFGADVPAEQQPLSREFLKNAIGTILNERLSGWPGLMGQPGEKPRQPDEIVQLDAARVAQAQSSGVMVGHFIVQQTRMADITALVRDDSSLFDVKPAEVEGPVSGAEVKENSTRRQKPRKQAEKA